MSAKGSGMPPAAANRTAHAWRVAQPGLWRLMASPAIYMFEQVLSRQISCACWRSWLLGLRIGHPMACNCPSGECPRFAVILRRRMNGRRLNPPVRYLAGLSFGRLVLWCYFIWYLVVLIRYFDPSPRLWLTSLGLSLIVGLALLISTTRSGSQLVRLEPWPTFRLFLMPFCVSSFSALVKGRGFVLIFAPHWGELASAVGLCTALCAAAAWARRAAQAAPAATPDGPADTTGQTPSLDQRKENECLERTLPS